jgi:outer membrane receptor protein involved in Fe transport
MSATQRQWLRPFTCLVSGLFVFTTANAQDSAPAEEETLEEVVVTAVARPVNRLESSISTSALSIDALNEIAPRSVAEVFRSLPGIRSESSGGNGNANITIRGIPLATGGAKYLQLHEDGLPVVEYGDMNFANGDNFIRYDGSVSRIESVRGGSASTFASNSPGGIINMISNYGDKEGGRVGLSYGLDYDELRTDFSYGGALSDTINYHIGGFYRTGEGVRETGFDGDKGGQVKFNLTKNFDDGFIRFFAKRLDDRVTTYMPAPVLVKSNGDFGPVAGFDASTQALHSPYQATISTFNAFGDRLQRDVTEGIHSKVSSFGFEFDRDLGNGWRINNKFRTSEISGSWISPFTDGVGTVGGLADGVCAGSPANGMGQTLTAADCTNILAANITLGSGPSAGTTVSRAALGFQNLLFDVTFNDVGNLINDLKVSKEVGRAAITVGLYKSKQAIDIDWNSWPFILETFVGGESRTVNVQANNGAVVANNGLWFPGLLSWAWDLEYDTTAPYLNVAFDLDQFNFDISVRRDEVEARGQRSAACCGRGAFGSSVQNGILVDVDNNGQIDFWEARGVAVANNASTVNFVNYDADNTAFSLGGTWLFRDNMSVFARYSDGGRAIADRLLQIDGAINPDGSLDSSFDGFDNVEQLEVGYKYKSGPLAFYATFFNTKTEETNAEITSGATFVRDYEANGLELEGNYSINNFGIAGNITWTDAEIKADRNNAAVVGNKPRRQADLIYTLTPSYRADRWSIGATFQGSSEYYLADVNQLKQDGYVIVHAFGSFRATDALTVSFNINNLTDEFVLTEAEEGVVPAAIAGIGSVVRGRPLSGRSSMLSVRYEF